MVKLITALTVLPFLLVLGSPVVATAAQGAQVLLTGQSSTVEATPSDQSSFTLSVAVTGAPLASTEISTVLYPRLSSRSGLLAALDGQGLNGPIDQSTALALSCLPVSPKGGRALSIDVVTSPQTIPSLPGGCSGSTSPPSYDLRCSVGTGSCNGVYPLVITVDEGGSQLARFITLMTYVERAAAVPLKVATVLRLGNQAKASSPGALSSLSHALRGYPGVAEDLSLAPQAIKRLETGAKGRSALHELAQAMSVDPAAHEMPQSPFVAIDPGVLAASGLADDLSSQTKRGQQLATAAGFPLAASAAGWLASAPVTSTTLIALSAVGIDRLVIPESSLASTSTSSTSWGQPFSLSPSSAPVTALAADASLSAQMLPGSQPVLAAERLLGDLAFLHFERPSLSFPQGVVAETPDGFVPSADFLDTLFEGLSSSPVFASSTLSGLFASLSPGANGSASVRQLDQTAPSNPWPNPQVNQLNAELARQAAFASAAKDSPSTIQRLSDDALSTENDQLSNAARSRSLGLVTSALDAQLAQIQISSAEITMTALNGTIPITLTSTASYPITGVLAVASPQLRFPHGALSNQTIDRSTTSVRIAAQAVTTGDFTMTATLLTPQGGLQIASQKITVRATQSSLVGVVLTAGALLVLLIWWLRTWRTKGSRARRRR
jgi:hypothetical protein